MCRGATLAGVSAAVLLSGCTLARTGFRPPREGGPAWHEFTTQHFVFETDLGDTSVDALANQVENARNVMVRMAFGRSPPPGPKIRVIALPYSDFRSFQDDETIGVYVPDDWYEPVLVTGTSNERGSPALDLITHELGHAVASQFIPAEAQPRWFAEGIAGYLETARYVRSSGTAYLGMAPDGYRDAPPLLPIDELWGWGDPEFDPKGIMTQRRYYTTWAVLHYLFDDRRPEFDRYAAALTAREDAHAAWTRVLPDLHGEAADRALRAFMQRYGFDRNFGVKKATLPKVDVHISARTLSDADVLAIRALLHTIFSGESGLRSEDEDARRARDYVTQALHEDGSSLWAHLFATRFLHDKPAPPDAAKRATEVHPDDWLAWLAYDEALHQAGASIEERRAALSRAGALAPHTELVEQALQRLGDDATAQAPRATNE